MDVTIGRVVDGKIVVEGDELPEGSTVGIFVSSESEPYKLSDDEAAELDRAIADVRAGQHVDADTLLARLTSASTPREQR